MTGSEVVTARVTGVVDDGEQPDEVVDAGLGRHAGGT